MKPNTSIFEKGSGHWKYVTDNGTKPVPKFSRWIVKVGGKIVGEGTHPVTYIGEDKWEVDYNVTT